MESPRPDGVEGFWLKAFPEITAIFGLWKAIKYPKHVEQWLVGEGRSLYLKMGAQAKSTSIAQ